MNTTASSNHARSNPRSLPGRTGERRYLHPAPSSSILSLTIGLLYLAGLGVTGAGGLIGAYIGAYYDYVVRLMAAFKVLGHTSTYQLPPQVTPGVAIPGAWTPILVGLLIGLLVGLLAALPLFARAQMLRLYVCIEENTRETKELLYYLLSDQKK